MGEGPWLTSVFGPQSQHEAQGKGFGPGHLCSVDQQAKEVRLVRQRQTLKGLEGGAQVQEARVLLAAQEAAAAEQGQRQVLHHLSCTDTEGGERSQNITHHFRWKFQYVSISPCVRAALTCEGVPVQLDDVAENVFGEAFLFRQTLQQQHHLRLAHGMHSLCRHAPALPVHIWHAIKANTSEVYKDSLFRRVLNPQISTTESNLFVVNNNEQFHLTGVQYAVLFEENFNQKRHTVDQLDHCQQVGVEDEHQGLGPATLQLLDEQHLRGLLLHSII